MRSGLATTMVVAGILAGSAALAQPQYDTGASDTEIRIGNTASYSGPLSFYAELDETLVAYFRMINDRGGINGRRVTFITYDDGYNPARAFEQTRRLVERDRVLFMLQMLGTDTALAARDYLNARGIPQLFLATPSDLFADPQNYPWTVPYQLSYLQESRIIGQYIRETFPGARVGILYDSSVFGTDLLAGVTEGLEGVHEIVALPYAQEDLTIDSQILQFQAAGVDVLVDGGSAKFTIQAIRKVADIGWDLDEHIITSVSSSVTAVLEPAGLENSMGLVSVIYQKDPADPRWLQDPGYMEYAAFMEEYRPGGDVASAFNAYAYNVATLMTRILERCGDNLTRENILRQTLSLRDEELPMMFPGILLTTGAHDYRPIEAATLVRFDGVSWVPFGEVIGE